MVSFSLWSFASLKPSVLASTPRSFFAVLGCVLIVTGCDRSAAEPPVATSSVAASSAASKNVEVTPPNTPLAGVRPIVSTAESKSPQSEAAFKFPAAARVVAIGDLHGDFLATKKAFKLAGAIDEKGAWTGEKLVVVQTGDQLDRGDDEEKILTFLKRLKQEAKSAGGAVHVLNGNHETMNVQGDFRYVTAAGFTAFETWKPASTWAASAPAQYKTRANAFLPGGGAAREIAAQPLVIMVGDTVFAHAGVVPQLVDYGIDKLNAETQAWMEGAVAGPPGPVADPDGPVWTRIYGSPVLEPGACAILDTTLKKLGAVRMVVGHTVQERGMASACDERVFRIDVGLARYYGDHPVQVLEMLGDKARILTATE